MTPGLLDAALAYPKRGLSIIPIEPRGKRPLIQWDRYQTERADVNVIKKWFADSPGANIAIVTGAVSDVIVIDIDSDAARNQLKQIAREYDLDSVPRSRTGKGWQLFFRHPGVNIQNRAGIIPGLDVRGDGGYVVAPPSIHPNGREYKWEVPLNDELPKLPVELFKLITGSNNGNGYRERFNTAEALKGVPEGQRDNVIFRLACKLRSADVPQDMAEALILEAAKNCEPPFAEKIALEKIVWAYSKYSPREEQIKKSLIESMETIVEEETDFLWLNRIPRGKLTDFSGDPGVGKSTVASAIAAALSTGRALPFDKEPEAPLRSLIISAEDGAADTLKPRLRRMGADMSMIAIPSRALMPSQINPALIDQMLDEFPAALVVVDPIIAYTNRRNTDKASDVRDILGPLTAIAEKHRAAIILIRHLNKSTQSKALYRGQGSIDFAAACRSAFVFAQDPNDPERRLMAHVKSSLSRLQPTLEFSIGEHGEFSFGEQTTETADEALGTGEPRKEREAQQLESAKRFLEGALSNGPMASSDIKTKAQGLGISNATLWRAKEKLDIRASKERGTGEWFWRLG